MVKICCADAGVVAVITAKTRAAISLLGVFIDVVLSKQGWRTEMGSNHRRSRLQRDALPSELSVQGKGKRGEQPGYKEGSVRHFGPLALRAGVLTIKRVR